MSNVAHGGLDDRDLAMLGRSREEMIDLSANLHPDGPPTAVIEALRSAIVGHYPSVDAAPLREALAAMHGVDSDCVIVTPGASAAIYLATAALVAPGERCAVFTPTFGEYERAIEAVDGEVVRCVAEPTAFRLPAMPSRLTAAVLCNPNNPTGTYLDRASVEALLGATQYLLIDAAYEPLVEDRWAASDLVRDGAPVAAIYSLTKLFAIPGVRLGYVLAPPAIAALIRRRQPPWPVGSADIAAGLAAVAGVKERRASVPALHDRRRRLERAFADLDVPTTRSRTNFVLAEVGDVASFRAALLACGFVVRDAASFGLTRWIRVAVPAEQAMDRLVSAIGEAQQAGR